MENIYFTGKYNSAIAYIDYIDTSARGFIQAFLDSPISENSDIRFMPDVHSGKGCCIGTTMTIKDIIVPGFVGIDIGCGVIAYEITKGKIELEKLDKFITQQIPSGFAIRNKPHPIAEDFRKDLEILQCVQQGKKIDIEKTLKYIGSLGSGNHFIELAKSENTGNYWLLIHSGSRHLGVDVCSYYHNIAAKFHPEVPYEFAYFDSRDKEEEKYYNAYLYDMEVTQKFAAANRVAIGLDIIANMKWNYGKVFHSIHNYINSDKGILRKGAISATKDELMIIPLNMRDGSLICVGLGNPNWNYSAPHGSGRKMARKDAKESLTLTEYKKEMKGIYSSSISRDTIDESPMAYKDSQDIIDRISDTCIIIDRLKPVYNFKASERGR